MYPAVIVEIPNCLAFRMTLKRQSLKSFSKTSAQQAIDGKLGDELAKFLYANKDKPDEILLKSNFKLVNQFVINY